LQIQTGKVSEDQPISSRHLENN